MRGNIGAEIDVIKPALPAQTHAPIAIHFGFGVSRNGQWVEDLFTLPSSEKGKRLSFTRLPAMTSPCLCRSQLAQKGVDRPFSWSINQQVESDHDLCIFGANLV